MTNHLQHALLITEFILNGFLQKESLYIIKKKKMTYYLMGFKAFYINHYRVLVAHFYGGRECSLPPSFCCYLFYSKLLKRSFFCIYFSTFWLGENQYFIFLSL